MNAKPANRWSSPIKVGLLGGTVAIYLSLVGILTALANRAVITGVISLGQVILLGVYIMFGYMAAQRAAAGQDKAPVAWCLVSGALAGLITSVFLVALVVIAPLINLRSIFINASPELWDLLTFGLGVPAGLVVLLAVGLVVGALSAGLFLLPSRIRRSVGLGLAAIPIVSILNSSLFAGRGLSPIGALVTFVVATVIAYFWQPAAHCRLAAGQAPYQPSNNGLVVTAAYHRAGSFRPAAAPVGTLPGRDPGHSRHLRPDGPGPQHRRRLCRPARPGLRGLLRPRRLHHRHADLTGDPVAGRPLDLVAGAAVCGAGGARSPA